MGALPLGLWIGFIMLAITFVAPQVSTLLLNLKLSLVQLKEVEIYMKKLNKAKNEGVQVTNLTKGEDKNGGQKVYLVELKSLTTNKNTVHKQKLLKMTETNGAYVRKVKGECKKYTIDLSAGNNWENHEIPLLFLSIFLNIALFAFHILSAVEMIKYGNDVLQSHQDFSKDHSSLPTENVTVSFIIIIVTYISVVLISVFRSRIHNMDHRCTQNSTVVSELSDPVDSEGRWYSLLVALNFLASMSVTINIIHILCYFLPYMLLAFIYNPLQTCVTYLALGLYVLGAYFLFWIIQHLITSYIKFINSETTVQDLIPFLRFYAPQSYTDLEAGGDIKLLHCICIFSFCLVYVLGIGMVLAVVYFSNVIIYVLTLGSLNDFEVIQNLVPPLLIGALTYFVVKPTFKQAKQKINPGDEGRIEKLLKEHTKKDTKMNS